MKISWVCCHERHGNLDRSTAERRGLDVSGSLSKLNPAIKTVLIHLACFEADQIINAMRNGIRVLAFSTGRPWSEVSIRLRVPLESFRSNQCLIYFENETDLDAGLDAILHKDELDRLEQSLDTLYGALKSGTPTTELVALREKLLPPDCHNYRP